MVPNHCSEDSRVRTGITEQVMPTNLPNVRVSFCEFSGPFGVLWDKCESDVRTSKGDSIQNLSRVFFLTDGRSSKVYVILASMMDEAVVVQVSAV